MRYQILGQDAEYGWYLSDRRISANWQVLMNHIRDKLPDMKARLNTLMGQTQQELNAFGDATFLGEQHRVGPVSLTRLTAGVTHP